MNLESSNSTALLPQKGCSFEDLCCRTASSYAFDYTVDIRGKNFEQSKEAVRELIYHCIRRLEANCQKKVKRFYIGRSYLQLKAIQSIPMSVWPYENDGIYSCWLKHRHEYGKDGMVVLTVITKEAIPENAEPGLKLGNYALALEQALLHHFKITNYDPRIANQSFSVGHTSKNKHDAYAIYMTFQLDDLPAPSSPLDPQSSNLPPPALAHSSSPSSLPGYPHSHIVQSVSNPNVAPTHTDLVQYASPPVIQFTSFN